MKANSLLSSCISFPATFLKGLPFILPASTIHILQLLFVDHSYQCAESSNILKTNKQTNLPWMPHSPDHFSVNHYSETLKSCLYSFCTTYSSLISFTTSSPSRHSYVLSNSSSFFILPQTALGKGTSDLHVISFTATSVFISLTSK